MLKISLLFKKFTNLRILRINNAKVLGYCFYMNTNISRGFQICISVPLNLLLDVQNIFLAVFLANYFLWAFRKRHFEKPLLTPADPQLGLYIRGSKAFQDSVSQLTITSSKSTIKILEKGLIRTLKHVQS